jgi:hypothetical protein
LAGQQNGNSIADLFCEEAPVGSALPQLRIENLEQMFKAFIAERPAVHKIYHRSRKSSFGKLREKERIQIDPRRSYLPFQIDSAEPEQPCKTMLPARVTALCHLEADFH